ncbi:unnamed protein product [Sphagnum jensenii]|uniref:UBC core domain-containing protein n=1 Tax=Sphagnum jensenii TaxID=128206 RepID=A0ABP0W0J4_9BRYO
MQEARLAGRLQQELKMLQDPSPGVCVWPSDELNLSQLEAQILGPEGTVYANGIFKLQVRVPDRYPFEPPNVKFVTPIYHPNIDTGGRICHDILNMPPKGQWKPSLNIGAVLGSIRVLMAEPNHDDGLMGDITAEYKHNRAVFNAKARQWTEQYAIQKTSAGPSTLPGTSGEAPAQAAVQEAACVKDQCNQDTTRPHLEECKRMGDQEEIVEKLYASTSCEVLPTNVAGKPRQGLISKLSLGKGANTLTEREDLTPEMAKDCAVKDPASLFVKKTNAAIQKSFCSTNQTTSDSGGKRNSIQTKMVETTIIASNKENILAVTKPKGEESDLKAVKKTAGRDLASHNIEKKHIPQAEKSLSQGSQRTSVTDGRLKTAHPRPKSLKLSRGQGSRLQVPSLQNGQEAVCCTHSKEESMHKEEPVANQDVVILLDSESDEEYSVQFKLQSSIKRKAVPKI